jgi:oxygen-independent coproporphyrinogen-3 oxidase
LYERHVPPAFIEALCREIAAFEADDVQVESIFFGGGTPSLIHPDSLATVLDALRTRFVFSEPELTLEANPDDVTSELVDTWQNLGVNRISLGVQSFDDTALEYLGRRHDAAGARAACDIIAARFENWSLDLMFGAHPVSSWEGSLRTSLSFQPAHLSAYGLTYEPGTPFGKRSDEAIDDETYLAIYRQTLAMLDGYTRYEVSNFARSGYACRHNLRYWRNEAYAGFGPAAYSYIGAVRSRNEVKLEDYLNEPGAKCEALPLSDREQRVETLIQHFRLESGLNSEAYRARFGQDPAEDYGPELQDLVTRGLLSDEDGILRPTERGFELNNEIGLALVDA